MKIAAWQSTNLRVHMYVIRDNEQHRILAFKVSKGPPKFDVNVSELYSYCRVPVVNTLVTPGDFYTLNLLGALD